MSKLVQKLTTFLGDGGIWEGTRAGDQVSSQMGKGSREWAGNKDLFCLFRIDKSHCLMVC